MSLSQTRTKEDADIKDDVEMAKAVSRPRKIQIRATSGLNGHRAG